MEREELLTTSEAAQILRLTPAMVRYLEKTGQLAAVRTRGGTRIFNSADVERLQAERAERQNKSRNHSK